MDSNVVFARHVLASALWIISVVMVIQYIVVSLRYATRAAQGHDSLGADNKAPRKWAIYIMVAVTIAVCGLIIWFPRLVKLMPFWIALIVFMGFSIWINLKVRLSAERKWTAAREAKSTGKE